MLGIRPYETNGTTELVIVPLTREQVLNYVYKVRQSSESELFWIELFMLPKLETLPVEKHIFYTFWLGIDKSTMHIVTEFVFKGEPDDGEVEIGFHTSILYEGKGYMKETVKRMIEISRGIPEIKTLTAIAEHPASVKILTSNGFELNNNIYSKTL